MHRSARAWLRWHSARPAARLPQQAPREAPPKGPPRRSTFEGALGRRRDARHGIRARGFHGDVRSGLRSLRACRAPQRERLIERGESIMLLAREAMIPLGRTLCTWGLAGLRRSGVRGGIGRRRIDGGVRHRCRINACIGRWLIGRAGNGRLLLNALGDQATVASAESLDGKARAVISTVVRFGLAVVLVFLLALFAVR